MGDCILIMQSEHNAARYPTAEYDLDTADVLAMLRDDRHLVNYLNKLVNVLKSLE